MDYVVLFVINNLANFTTVTTVIITITIVVIMMNVIQAILLFLFQAILLFLFQAILLFRFLWNFLLIKVQLLALVIIIIIPTTGITIMINPCYNSHQNQHQFLVYKTFS